MDSTFHSNQQTKYRIVSKIGNGAFGEVSRAQHVETGEVVALKRVVVRQPELGLPDNILREMKALQCIEHPNVVSLHEVYPEGSALTLVLEYCSTDLSELLKNTTAPLDEAVIKCILQQILRGLAACHANGILHRDLKPSNVLITTEGTVKLADFGLARPHDGGERPMYSHAVATRWQVQRHYRLGNTALESSAFVRSCVHAVICVMHSSRAMCGGWDVAHWKGVAVCSPQQFCFWRRYRAPELLYAARSYGPQVDMWAVGAIFAELLGLGPLFAGENDIDQLAKVQALLGTLDEEVWPGVKDTPDYGKISFPRTKPVPLAEALPDASATAISLLEEMLRYNPDIRVTADDALLDDFFLTQPLPARPSALAQLVSDLMS